MLLVCIEAAVWDEMSLQFETGLRRPEFRISHAGNAGCYVVERLRKGSVRAIAGAHNCQIYQPFNQSDRGGSTLHSSWAPKLWRLRTLASPAGSGDNPTRPSSSPHPAQFLGMFRNFGAAVGGTRRSLDITSV